MKARLIKKVTSKYKIILFKENFFLFYWKKVSCLKLLHLGYCTAGCHLCINHLFAQDYILESNVTILNMQRKTVVLLFLAILTFYTCL